MNAQIHVRIRQDGGGFSDPVPAALPLLHIDDQFVDTNGRCFVVTCVEWRFDLARTPVEGDLFPGPEQEGTFQVHLFCVEHPAIGEIDEQTHDTGWRGPLRGLLENVTPQQGLITAAFDIAIFGGTAAVLSQSWMVGLGTAVVGAVASVFIAPMVLWLSQQLEEDDDGP